MKHLYPIALVILFVGNVTFLQSQSQNGSKILVSDNVEQFISGFNETNKNGKQESNIVIKLPTNETLTLHFNVRKQVGQALRLIGPVNQNENSSYNMIFSNGKLEGDIIQIDKKSAYKIFTSADSKVYVEETDINSIICIGLPKVIDLPEVKNSSAQKSEKKNNSGAFQSPLTLQSRPGATGVIYLDFDGEDSSCRYSMEQWQSY